MVESSGAKGVLREKLPEHAMELAQEERYRLKRELGWFELMLFVLGATIGAGIFVLPGVAAAKFTGPAVMISYALGGIVTIAVALAYTEFASMVPVAGSAYTYSYVALGEILAWIVGWDLIFEFTMIASTVAVGWGGYFNSFLETIFGITLPQAISHDITHGGIVNLPAILGLLIVAWIALTGIRASGIANALFTTAKVFAILFVLTVGVFYIKLENWTTPFAPYGLAGIMTGAALTFFAYTGFDGITSLLEEVKRPERDIPIALIGGISLCALFYVAMSAVITGMVHWTKLDVPNPAAFVLMQVGIPWGGALISISVLFGLIATMLGNSLSASRILFAMGRDGLLPEWFAFVHPTRRVPRNAAYVIYTAAIIFAGFLSISELAELANIGGLTAFTLVTISVMVMRYTDPERKRIFKVPAIWVIGPIGIIGSLALIASLPVVTFIRFTVWLVIGLIIYFSYGYKHSKEGTGYYIGKENQK
ncbi:amino acid permease [Caldanaerobacter subterraneus subsp. yonseiensis KB-1]|uniref:Amino acid permease n=1 Tax=Caldanaerobacter subterraneus subsp. yonseiensis KB-1 TaxID=1388761 RepID=U5CTF8_CALSX|nr:amino acid permease [Caldanaerobacter subterraneus]ERM91377.1 amino acid permease [Caldanaerobacter subterraneus subsp. yonseiensis KB-1]